MKAEKERFYIIDAIRGLALLHMILFHLFYDIFVIWGRDPGWYGKSAIVLWQQGICWTFILISGFAWNFGKNHSIRRGIFLNICGGLITLVTGIAVPDQTAYFGILNFLGCGILLTAFLEKPLLNRIPAGIGLAGSMFCFLLLQPIQSGRIGIGPYAITFPRVSSYPSALTAVPGVVLGFPDQSFYSSDYFPILPWFFLYMVGYYLYQLFMKQPGIPSFLKYKIPFLSDAGRYSIWIYLTHQPVCMGISLLFELLL